MVICKRAITVRVGNNDNVKEYSLQLCVTLREVLDTYSEYEIVNIINKDREVRARFVAKNELMNEIRERSEQAGNEFPIR